MGTEYYDDSRGEGPLFKVTPIGSIGLLEYYVLVEKK